jgi:hypothetical protein
MCWSGHRTVLEPVLIRGVGVPISPLPQRTVRSILATGAAVLLAASVTAGCGAGFDAQTNQVYQAAEGANGDSGSIAARNFLIVADDQGKGTLHGVLVNTGDTDDRLASIAVDPSVEGVRVTGAEPAPLPAGESVTLSGRESGSKPVAVTGAKPGQMIKLTVSFGDAGPITMLVPVITEDHHSPSPKPKATEG